MLPLIEILEGEKLSSDIWIKGFAADARKEEDIARVVSEVEEIGPITGRFYHGGRERKIDF